MTPMPLPLTRDLVLIGGGHAHALVLRRWGMAPLPGARLTLIDPGPAAPYTGMLPGFVAGHYEQPELEIDLVRLARFAGARLIPARATGIDREAKRILLDDRPPVAYDVASIDIGITSAMPDLPGFSEHAVPAKPLGRFAARWRAFRAGEGPADIAVIGAGVGGVELALAMAHAMAAEGRPARLNLIEKGRALDTMPDRARARLLGHLDRAGIALLEGATVERVAPGAVHLTDGREIPAALTVGTAGARPWPWLDGTGLALTDGFIDVDRTLSTSDPAIFAAGDCAHLTHAPRPKAGVFAVRAAPTLTHNLAAALSETRRRPFRPQRDYIKLISLGSKSALFEKWGVVAEGPGLWRLKNGIDQRFMAKFQTLPPMPQPKLPARFAKGVGTEFSNGKPLCAGCGAKVGSGALSAALARLPEAARADIEPAPGDDAAILTHGGTRQVITTDHLRAFTEDPRLFARIAALHAMGDIWAMGARPQAALATVILPRMNETLQNRTLDEVMAAAAETFAEAGAAIVGGHTTQGAEFTLGFTVTGLAEGRAITLKGARPGDALLLTRPIGAGVLMAAEMALAAAGPDILSLFGEMARSQGAAARILSGAHAMTDVTGFGLAGHLLNMADASGVGAELRLGEIPLYAGARALAAAGTRSTLQPANRAAAGGRVEGPEGAETDLLFDPQTAGGLLAAVPEDEAPTLLDQLAAEGYTAARIGTVTDGPPRITLR